MRLRQSQIRNEISYLKNLYASHNAVSSSAKKELRDRGYREIDLPFYCCSGRIGFYFPYGDESEPPYLFIGIANVSASAPNGYRVTFYKAYAIRLAGSVFLSKVKKTETPIGNLAGPISPAWQWELIECESREDLYQKVDESGFINPDALNEVVARSLYSEYQPYKESQKVNS